MEQSPQSSTEQVLDPIDRISEVMFGLIMALTFTCTLGVASADSMEVRTMLIGALGCNLAWGLIDGGMFLMARLHGRARAIASLLSLRRTGDVGAAQRIIADAMPPILAQAITSEQLEGMRRKLCLLPEPGRPRLTRPDQLGALAIFLLSFMSTFPIVIPFLFIDDARLALRVSNLIAIVMLFLCGYASGQWAGFRPWVMGLSMVALGSALVAVAIALGG